MMAHYYPLVQQYLQQQKQQPEEKACSTLLHVATVVCACVQERLNSVMQDADDDFVFDYYAMRSSDNDTTMLDVDADLPVIQASYMHLFQHLLLENIMAIASIVLQHIASICVQVPLP